VSSSEPTLPRVSVVIPVRDEARYIRSNVEAVLAQDYPADRLEVLVADGRSTDGTREILERMIAERPAGGARLRMVDNPRRIMPTGTNAAIREAQGDVIHLLGGHAQLPQGYLRACVGVLLERDADAAGGALNTIGDNYVSEVIAAAMSSPLGIGNADFRTAGDSREPIPTDTIPFGCYRRRVFERIGLFNPHMVRHQDYEFHWRLREAGGRILLLPWMKARYHARRSIPALWRQYWHNGVWKGRFVRKFPRSLRVRHLVPTAFALALLGSGLLALLWRPSWPLLALVAGAYGLFLLAAMAVFAARGRWRELPLLPVVLLALHLSYGLGVWLGLMLPRVPDAPRLGDPA
jgi:cellulose synthase/poly-beta-1,6-N-acetylglucosamine synthase-like glycosyltransferase